MTTPAEQLKQMEDYTGHSLPFLHELLAVNPEGFARFLEFMPLSSHAAAASINQLTVARLLGSLNEDCGSCVQINVDLAVAAGADVDLIRAVLDRKPEAIKDPELRAIYDYCDAVLKHETSLLERLDDLKQRIGATAASDLGLAMASHAVFPILKRAMGLAITCSKVAIRVPENVSS